MSVTKKHLTPHEALVAASKSADTFEGLATVTGFIAPSPDDGVLEVLTDVSGAGRVYVPRAAVVHTEQDEQGEVTLYVLQSTELRVATVAAASTTADSLDGALLGGLGDELAMGLILTKKGRICGVLSALTKYLCPLLSTLVCGAVRA